MRRHLHPSGLHSDDHSMAADWHHHMNATGMIPEMDSEVTSLKSESKNKLLLNFGKDKQKELYISIKPDKEQTEEERNALYDELKRNGLL